MLASFDANLRLPLWPSEKAAYCGILTGLKHADVVKLREEEFKFLVKWVPESGEPNLSSMTPSCMERPALLCWIFQGEPRTAELETSL